MAGALVQGGVENASKLKPNGGKVAATVTGTISEGHNLAVTAKAVNGANTPHKSKAAPRMALVVFAELDAKSAEAATAALAKVAGVDAEGSNADATAGAIHVGIAGTDAVTVADILSALKGAGVAASISKAN